jgi:hypothetical protein
LSGEDAFGGRFGARIHVLFSDALQKGGGVNGGGAEDLNRQHLRPIFYRFGSWHPLGVQLGRCVASGSRPSSD